MSERNTDFSNEPQSWWAQLRASYSTPLGMIGVGITTVFFVLSVLGLIVHMSGMVKNPYAVIITIVLFPTCMFFGLLLVPVAAVMRRRKIFAQSLTRTGFIIDLGNEHHRKVILLLLVLSAINISLFSTVIYQGYHYMDSTAFCGTVCHTVMAPEYTAHERSPHSDVACVECHIAPGIGGFLQAKFAGLKQLKDIVIGSYHRPIPNPVKELPSAAATCENCHSPNRYFGDKKKVFIKYSNENQKTPEKQEVVLHLGGHDPISDRFKGIHWHADPDIQIYYQPLKADLTKIGAVRVVRANGTVKMFNSGTKNNNLPWRHMDCTDCHNRPTHIFDDPVERVDFGLYSRKISADIPGIRQDSLTVLRNQYKTREEAGKEILPDLKKLQEKRNGKDFVSQNEQAILKTAAYLKEEYLGNVWPKLKISWGTYKSEIGHQHADKGFGCFRCHDEEHATDSGDTISQDCGRCHKEPE
jgi:NapC/NirT cytochrome c family, N-terminal region